MLTMPTLEGFIEFVRGHILQLPRIVGNKGDAGILHDRTRRCLD